MEFRIFDTNIWQFVKNMPIINTWEHMAQIKAVTKESMALSKDMNNRFPFVGPTIIYTHMQAVGMVNDHEVPYFRYKELQDIT